MLLEEIRHIDAAPKALRSFGRVVGGVLLLIAGVLFWRAGWAATTAVYVLGGIGSALVLLGLAAPRVLRPLYLVWMALALVLGFIMTRVILTVVFYLITTPIGVVRRLLGHDPMHRTFDAAQPTYWIDKDDGEATPERLTKYY